MSNKTRKHIWPVSLTAALGIMVMLAMMAAVVWTPGPAFAQGGGPSNPFGTPPDDGSGPTNPFTPPGGGNGAAGDMIANSSTSGGAGVELILTISDFPMAASAGSSVELYLEDDFQVPDDIDRGDVYFTVTGPRSDATNDGGRVYAADPVEIDDDDHFGGDDDWSIRVFIPDMNTGDDFDGYNGPAMGQEVKLIFTKSAGIKNPTEAGTHSVGYSVLGPNDEANDGPMVKLDDVANSGAPLETKAKISLSDEDAGRGKEITITGSGFNNGTNAEVRVLVSATDLTEGDQAANCEMIIREGEKLGAARWAATTSS